MSNANAAQPPPPQKPASPIVGIIFVLILLGLGGGLLYWSGSQFWDYYASRSWARTEGQIHESRFIDYGRRRDGIVRLRYSYTVEGRAYEGGNLLPGSLAYTDADEKEKVRQYRPGMTVPVYYDPQHPESSALEVGVMTRWPFISLVIGLFFFGGGIYLAIALARNKPASPSPAT